MNDKEHCGTAADNDLSVKLTDFFCNGGTLSLLRGIEPREMEAGYTLGWNLYSQGRWESALQIFCFLCTYDQLDRRYHVAIGACFQMLKRYKDALKSYGVAHLMDLREASVGLQIVECLLALGLKGDATEALVALDAIMAGRVECDIIRRRARALGALLGQGAKEI